MPEQTTKPPEVSVESFLAEVSDERKRIDAERLCVMMTAITDEPPVMWGPSIVGFGSYHYRYASDMRETRRLWGSHHAQRRSRCT